ncbi:UNVERIFIED_CONTAM: response regulator [Halobacillus marinus]
MIKVLIVEDDPMVGELNKQYIHQMEGFTTVKVIKESENVLPYLEDAAVDLVLLDIYMPKMNGLELLKEIRNRNANVDVILITAASDREHIQKAMRYGAIDYLIKPFEFERFEEAVLRYKGRRSKWIQKDHMSQRDLDSWLRPSSEASPLPAELPKGLTKNTLHRVHKAIQARKGETFSTEDLSDATAISRVSIRKYLKFLSRIQYLEETLSYGVGRPIYLYQTKEGRDHVLHPYL